MKIYISASAMQGGHKERKIVTTGQKYNGPLLHRAAITNDRMKIEWSALFHRATINKHITPIQVQYTKIYKNVPF